MKRFVHNVLLFTLVALAALLLMLVATGGTGLLRNVKYHAGMWDFTCTRLHEAAETKDVDVLFLGSSHCYRTFDTRYYAAKGLRTFNLGSSNQTPLQSLMLLRLYVDSLRPACVVLEVHPDMMGNDGVESSIYLANNMKLSSELVRMSFATRNMKSVLSMIYSVIRNGLFPRTSCNEALAGGENEYVPGGFVESKGGCYHPEPHEPVEIRLDELQVESLQEIVKLLDSKRIPLLIAEVPYTRVLRESYTNHEWFEKEMSGYGAFVSPRLAELNDSLHFSDQEHLNQRGVEVFNEYFYDSVLLPFMNNNIKQ